MENLLMKDEIVQPWNVLGKNLVEISKAAHEDQTKEEFIGYFKSST